MFLIKEKETKRCPYSGGEYDLKPILFHLAGYFDWGQETRAQCALVSYLWQGEIPTELLCQMSMWISRHPSRFRHLFPLPRLEPLGSSNGNKQAGLVSGVIQHLSLLELFTKINVFGNRSRIIRSRILSRLRSKAHEEVSIRVQEVRWLISYAPT